ncbi:MAG: porin family protein [Gammaproteobacteria bacterium]
MTTRRSTMRKTLAFIFAAVMVAVSPVVLAEEDKTGFYVAPEVGLVKLQDWCGSTEFIRDTSCEDSEFGFGLSGGYRFNDFFAVEGGYRLASGYDAEGVALQDFPNGNALQDDIVSGEVDFSSWSLGLRGFFPVSEMFSATAAAGFHFWDLEVDIQAADPPNCASLGRSGGCPGTFRYSVDQDGSDLYLGLGGEFAATDNISIRASYTRYLTDDYDADVISGNIVWSF